MASTRTWWPAVFLAVGVAFGSLVAPAVVNASTSSTPGRAIVAPSSQTILAWGSCEEGCTQSIPACGTIGGIVVQGDGFVELSQSPIMLWRGRVRANAISHLADMFDPGVEFTSDVSISVTNGLKSLSFVVYGNHVACG
jgi:hypothetical protein